jgi:multidrug resistance protein MdtO
MVVAATIVMIICMVFRIPYGFQGAIFALLITRESPRATLQASSKLLVGIASSTVYVLLSVYLVINYAELHFIWIIFSLFAAFYALSATTDYATATTFAVVISVAIPFWDRYLRAETNVADTLWLALSALVGVLTLLAVEVIAARGEPGDEIVSPLSERLTAVAEVLNHAAEHGVVDDASKKNALRFAMLGTSRLRRLLSRSDYTEHYKAQMNTVVAAVGRLVDTAATLTQFGWQASSPEREKSRELAASVESIRLDLVNRRIPGPLHFPRDQSRSLGAPLLYEMEQNISVIPQAFADSESMGEYLPTTDAAHETKFVRADAFSNPRHAKFALKGCLAATIAYVIYNAIDWPGISTAVTTCLFTALSTIGSSRQKQLLRFTGALVGGFVLGMGAQVFILPYLDSIFGFTVLFMVVTAAASWFMTSSPRLSYFGLQMALAFYLINLQEFAFVTSLAVARDRVVGVLLGLFTMWLVFDQLWGSPAAAEMTKIFALNLRLLAEVAREPLSSDLGVSRARGFALRDTITESFDSVRATADAVLLEFGASRQQNMALRGRIQKVQPRLRTLFLTRMALWKYRARAPGFELPREVLLAQQEFDTQSAKTLDAIADRIEGKPFSRTKAVEESFAHLEQVCGEIRSQQPPNPLEPQVLALMALSNRSEKLMVWLDENV